MIFGDRVSFQLFLVNYLFSCIKLTDARLNHYSHQLFKHLLFHSLLLTQLNHSLCRRLACLCETLG